MCNGFGLILAFSLIQAVGLCSVFVSAFQSVLICAPEYDLVSLIHCT